MKSSLRFGLVAVLLLLVPFPALRSAEEGARYHSPDDIAGILIGHVKSHKNVSKLHFLCKTPGNRDVLLLELSRNTKAVPSVLVVANMEGDCPIATEAALELSRLLLDDWKGELENRKWYIVPVGNPDGYARYFSRPLHARFVNGRPFNDDNDDATDEDGPDDLNGDGLITGMRQVHPEGKWMAVEGNPVLMKRADAGKGEKGTYRLFTEGIDDDGDGKINEDPPGGVNPGHNFPHNFTHFTKTDGPWAASEAESRAVLRFAFDHPEIAMVLVFGRSNSLREVPESTKKTETAREKYKVPERMARRMGIDPEEEFALKDLVQMARDFTGYQDLTEDMVLQFLGVGAAANPDRRDLTYWNEISKRYNDFVKEAGLGAERIAPAKFSNGSVEEWAYFQYGVPTFSMDFWTLPVKEEKKEEGDAALTPDKIEKMSNEEFIEMGEERISGFLKATDAPSHFTAQMVINALQSGMMTTKKIAEFIRKKKEKEEAGGADETEQALFDFSREAFVEWREYDHPTLGTVEIGGKVPYAELAPPADSVRGLLKKQLPFVRELVKLVPSISFETVKVEQRGSDVWKVEAWVANNGFLPYPTYQGERCKRPTPVAVTLHVKQDDLLEGRKRAVSRLLGGSGGTQKTRWLVRAKKGTKVKLTAESFGAGRDEITVTLKGGDE